VLKAKLHNYQFCLNLSLALSRDNTEVVGGSINGEETMRPNHALVVPLLVTILSSCSGGGSSSELSKIPSKVWEGGTLLTIRTSTNQPGLLKTLFFERNKENGSHKRELSANQSVPVGDKSFLVSVPANVGGYIELGVPAATPGATITCSLESGGKELWKSDYQLEQPLGPNEACFVNVDVDDFSKGELSD
jgi:hypothetical protein